MNKVIIIGTDHINTLGVIRTFGENNIKSDVIIISNTKKIAVIKSKYVNKYTIINDINLLIEILLKEYKNEKVKPVIISTTDLIALELDNNYSVISDLFYLSNLKNQKLEYYMNKYNQFNLAKKNGIKTAKSEIFSIDSSKRNKIKFPVILKPVLSAYGKKDDITICNNTTEFELAKTNYKNNGYKDFLVQELITYDSECDVAGFAYNGYIDIPGIILKENIWPSNRGSTTYGKVVSTDKYKEEIELIKKMILATGFNGIFDIDFFIKDNKLYFNEINFRNGALSYAYGKSKICYNWYKSLIENKYISCEKINSSYYFIDDNSHLHNIFDKDITIKQYFLHLKKSKIKLAFSSKDKKPWLLMIVYKLQQKLRIK